MNKRQRKKIRQHRATFRTYRERRAYLATMEGNKNYLRMVQALTTSLDCFVGEPITDAARDSFVEQTRAHMQLLVDTRRDIGGGSRLTYVRESAEPGVLLVGVEHPSVPECIVYDFSWNPPGVVVVPFVDPGPA